MSTTKAPKGKIVFAESPVDLSEREERRQELMKKYPDGKVWIQPICDYKELVSMQNPRREDHYIPRITVIKVPVSTSRGTHPQTGLPRYDDKYVPIHLVDPEVHWPLDVRSDGIRGLGKTVLDPWDLLDFLDSFPGGEHLFRLIPVDPIIDKRIETGLKARGAKAALHDVVSGKKTRPTENIPEAPAKKDRRAGGVSFDEGLNEDTLDVAIETATEEA